MNTYAPAPSRGSSHLRGSYGFVSFTVAPRRVGSDTVPPAHEGPRRVLIVDDDGAAAGALTRELRSGELDAAFCRSEEAMARVAALSPDVVLIRVQSHDDRSLDTCRQVREFDPSRIRSVVAFGRGGDDEDVAVRAFECGADDYIANAGRARELRARVEGQLRHLRNREIMQWESSQRSSLRTMAHTDALTGVANRRGLSRALERMLASGEASTLVLVDLDHFKRINDTYGHTAGDLVLRRAARAIWSAASPGDIAGRWGGEEFAIVLRAARHETRDGTSALGERFRRSVSDVALYEIDESLRITASVGVTGWDGTGEPPAAADLFRAADEALYAAKRAGRNRVKTSRVPCS